MTGFSCCNLSAINVHKFVKDGEFDWDELYNTAFNVMELMDNIIDEMEFPDERFKNNAMRYRHVGIGPMGLSDAMFELDIKYDSTYGKAFASKVMRTITTACLHKSALLAKDRGQIFEYDKIKDDMEEIVFSYTDNKEVKDLIKQNGLRNVQVTTCQPTGTTALSCDASYGIEPCFGLTFVKHLISGDTMIMVNPVFKKRFEKEEWYTNDLIEKIFNNGGSLKNLRGIPKKVREVFTTAHDIKPKDRIDVQSALQQYCSSAISSTINLPKTTTKEEISDLYKYAYKKGLKGITVYRDGSKKNQPVTFSKEKKQEAPLAKMKLPTRLSGDRFTVVTGNGKLYVNTSIVENRPVEMFLTVGKSGQVVNTMTEAIGRLTSLALQYGVPVDELVKSLEDMNSDKPVWVRLEETDARPIQVLSIPDAIAKLLDRYYGKNRNNGHNCPTSLDVNREKCPECGGLVEYIEGCASCSSKCGWSKCS